MGKLFLLITFCLSFSLQSFNEGYSHSALLDVVFRKCVITIDDIIISNTIKKNFNKGLKKFEIRTKNQHVLIERINKRTYTISDLDKYGNILHTTYCSFMGKTK